MKRRRWWQCRSHRWWGSLTWRRRRTPVAASLAEIEVRKGVGPSPWHGSARALYVAIVSSVMYMEERFMIGGVVAEETTLMERREGIGGRRKVKEEREVVGVLFLFLFFSFFGSGLLFFLFLILLLICFHFFV